MTQQLPRPYSSFARPTADIRPPAPGEAYFGYPQPTRATFPVPQQAPSIFEPRAAASRSGSGSGSGSVQAQPIGAAQLIGGAQLIGSAQPVQADAQPAGSALPISPPAASKSRPPSHGSRKPAQSRSWVHFVGYPLAVILGVLAGAAVAEASGAPAKTDCHWSQSSDAGLQTAGCGSATRR
jgi:hypothetical protein